jgi:Xaa-Pro aminopeptidase
MTSSEIISVATDNRRRFLDSLNDGEAALIFGSTIKSRNGDADFIFRQSSDILYLSAWPEENVALFCAKRDGESEFHMFVQPKDEKKEIWNGRRYGPLGAVEKFGATEAYEYQELATKLPELLKGIHSLHYRFTDSADNDKLLMASISKARRAVRFESKQTPATFIDLHASLHKQRLQKSDAELHIIRRAAEITSDAHRAAMQMTKPGVFEYQLEAKISHVFRDSGGNGPGYTSIVGGGENAVILHYVENSDPLENNTLVCVDAGCEVLGYTADVTRTWPVSGRFTSAQKELYSAVLAAQDAAILSAKAKNTFMDVHQAAVRSLTESLVALGFLDGDIDDLVLNKKYHKWYMHGTSHWLGLDVHDVGSYSDENGSQQLLPGMILTVEPGLYVASDDETAPERFRGMGIRIEDDILITKHGNENLTASAPKSISEIEALMANC